MALIAPQECQQQPHVAEYLEQLLSRSDHPITQIHYIDVGQNMQNGGGSACLRLRLEMSQAALASVHQPCLLDDMLFARLNDWIDHYYRDELRPSNLADPQLLQESYQALDALSHLLALGNIYAFQQQV